MKTIQTAPLLLLISLFSITCTSADSIWTPGVCKGDYFYYEMYGVYQTNQSSLVIPQFEYNNTDWTRIYITHIEGSIVDQIYTLHFKNGSETSFSFKCNVDPANKSSLKFNEKGVPICAANLTVGDTVPTDETVIDETINRTYECGIRKTNHAFWNTSIDWGDIYFDCETGILVELHRTHRFVGNGTGEVVDKTDVIKISSTNRWQVTQNNQQSIRLLFAVLTVIIFGLLSSMVFIHRFITRKTHNCLPGNQPVNYK
jgi:hypothetical protein